MSLVHVFESAYRRERNPNATGMANPGDDDEFAPRNNPFANGVDPDHVEWDDDLPQESPEEERASVRAKQRRLDAALRGAQADQEEDEAQDLDDLQDIADGGDDDDDEAEGEQEMAGTERGIKTRCTQCGEAAEVMPPPRHMFARLSELGEDEASGTDKFRRDLIRWKCRSCEAMNKTRLRHHRLVKRTSEAAAIFRRSYYGAPERDSAAGRDAVQTFRESYQQHEDRAHWAECVRQYGG